KAPMEPDKGVPWLTVNNICFRVPPPFFLFVFDKIIGTIPQHFKTDYVIWLHCGWAFNSNEGIFNHVPWSLTEKINHTSDYRSDLMFLPMWRDMFIIEHEIFIHNRKGSSGW